MLPPCVPLRENFLPRTISTPPRSMAWRGEPTRSTKCVSIWNVGRKTKKTVRPILERLKQNSYLDDARYARQFVRCARNYESKERSASRAICALAECPTATSRPPRRARRRIRRGRNRARALVRRLKSLRGPLDERRKASLYRSLLRAGFSSDIIRRELRSTAKVALNDLPEAS